MSEQNSGEQPPRPRYGEYAPPGYQPPNAAPAEPTPPAAAPGWSTPSAPASGATYPAPSTPGGPTPGGPTANSAYDPSGWGDPPARRKPRRVWDIVLTSILLFLGLLGGGYGVLTGAALAPAIDLQHTARGLPPFHGDVSVQSAIIVISQIVIYLLALGLSILALVRRRLAFWIPLVAGFIAAIFFFGALIAAIFSDDALVATLTRS